MGERWVKEEQKKVVFKTIHTAVHINPLPPPPLKKKEQQMNNLFPAAKNKRFFSYIETCLNPQADSSTTKTIL